MQKPNDGNWFEDYVLQQVISISKECNINDAGMDFPVFLDEKKKINGFAHDFQLDIAFMRHYQAIRDFLYNVF